MPKKLIDPIAAIRKKLPTRERRTVQGDITLRAEADGPKIGMFVPFNRRSAELWGFTELIRPSAFTKTLQERGGDIVSLWNHDPNWVLGRQSNRTLALEEQEDGLHGTVALDGDDGMHRHFARRVERRDVIGTSFGFETVRDEWHTEADGTQVRELVEVRLWDVSPVTFPAYPDSGTEARSSAFDLAVAKIGADPADLADLLAHVVDGRVPEPEADEVRAWIDRLRAVLPVPAIVRPTDEELRCRLALRERLIA